MPGRFSGEFWHLQGWKKTHQSQFSLPQQKLIRDNFEMWLWQYFLLWGWLAPATRHFQPWTGPALKQLDKKVRKTCQSKWGCNHHKCAKLFLRGSVHVLPSKKKSWGQKFSGLEMSWGRKWPEMSQSRTCLRARVVQVLWGWTCPINSRPEVSRNWKWQKFRAGSVSWPEVPILKLNIYFCQGKESGLSCYSWRTMGRTLYNFM